MRTVDVKDMAMLINVLNKTKDNKGAARIQITGDGIMDLLFICSLFVMTLPDAAQHSIFEILDEFCKLGEKDLLKLLENLEDISHEGN